jgi:hypothetical protein
MLAYYTIRYYIHSMDRRIGIGETSSFRYIGIIPSIDTDLSEQILSKIHIPHWLSRMTSLVSLQIEDDKTHTEFGMDVGDALDILGSEKVDKETVVIATQIAEMLRANGDLVEILEQITIDYDHPMFGEDADVERAIIQIMRRQSE